MPRKKASVRWCSSGNDHRRLRHFAFSLPCFRFLSPTFALFASFLFSLSRLSFPSLASFARFFRLSFFPLPSFARSTPFRILFPGFSLSLPVFTASAPRFFGFRPYFFRHPPLFFSPRFTFSLLEKHIPPIRRTLTNSTPRFYPIFCMIHMAKNGAAIWNIPTIYVYLPSHSQKANTSSHPRVRNASQI